MSAAAQPAPVAELPALALTPWRRDGTLAVLDAAAPDLAWDYGGLHRRAARRASLLCDLGLVPGQLVAVPESPGLDLVLMQHALARAGAALLPLPGAAEDPVSRALLGQTGAEWVWVQGQGGGRLIPTDPGPAATGLPDRGPDRGPDRAAWPSPLALVVETSGSSGEPRAAMLTAANLLTSGALVNRRLGLGPGDRWLCCLKLRHIGGLSIAYRCALAGAGLVLRQGFEARTCLDDLGRQGITHVSLVPPMLARLLDLGGPPPAALRVALVGGQRLGESLARRALAAGWPLHLTYGMTETASQVATTDRLGLGRPLGDAGRPLPGMELDCGEPQGSAPLRLRGPLAMVGYAAPGRRPGLGLDGDGWLPTRDLARLDGQGHLHILGRADEVLVTGGAKVHPARVESVLQGVPGVGDLAVLGVDDPVWGRRLVALYSGSCAPAELELRARERLAGAERPRAFIRLGELPLLPSGKLDRLRLLEIASLDLP